MINKYGINIKQITIKKYIFQSGVGEVSNYGFSFHRSALSDVNAFRNPLRYMYQQLQPIIRQQNNSYWLK
jgi:hypothetical protein